jgi:6-pyruvoyltetrahydropterin/6-carboxytetrahydropterin synthase
MNLATVIRVEHFNAAHRLNVDSWSKDKNEAIFGKCNNSFYHGHNYKIEVHVTGPIDELTGYVIDMKELKTIILEEITDAWDHKNLNEQVEEFKLFNPTAENIAMIAHQKIYKRLNDSFKLKVVLYETERNIVEYHG